MSFSSSSLRIWPVAPDWSGGVTERLSFGTDVMHASATGVSQHRGYQIGPRRGFGFDVLADRRDRRIVDMLLAGHGGVWHLPIWPDVQWFGAVMSSGSSTVPCQTAGFDFVAGGNALLYSSSNRWEVVEIDSIASDQLALAAPTTLAFGPGDRLFPLRRARLQRGAEEANGSDEVSRRRVVMAIDEPSDWPALADPTLYLTHPVLDVRPDESEDPTSSYERLIQCVAYDGALPFEYDVAGVALRAQRTHWKLFGRAQHSWFRSLVYSCDGRRVPFWVPSWNSDLRAVAAIAGGSSTLSAEWAGYTLFGLGQHNRKDVRIELVDGTVLYRRITNAVEAGEAETLTLSASLDAGSIAPEYIRAISFMALSALASDEVEIEHLTDQDGTARSTLGWQAVVPDV